jgi:DNA-binding MarR family transcriptional regulator
MPELKYPSSLSVLQQRILEIVCTQKNVTYKKLVKEIRKDRVTILQSIESLIKKNYITKQRVKPEFDKSILVFKPTCSGKSRAASIQNVNLEGILRMEKDKDIDNYLDVIGDITDTSQRDKFIEPLQKLLTRPMDPAFYNKLQTKKNDLKNALIKGILENIQNKNYDAEHLLNERSIRPLRELLGSSDIRELRCLLSNLRNKVNMTIERLPD